MIRVFPRKTKMSPDDKNAYYGGPPLWGNISKPVNVSCTFTYDKPRAEQLAKEWSSQGYKVRLGGPAYGDYGGNFNPGQYVKIGGVITSRGCNNECWFCSTWQREGKIRELPIMDGYNVMDSNLLQCSEEHIRAVFTMLKNQPQKAEFTGGFEAAILEDWHIELLVDLKPLSLYFAYDKPEDYEPLVRAAKMVKPAVFTPKSHNACCYVLMGYFGDTMAAAEKRCNQVLDLGLTPFGMLYQGENGNMDYEWKRFQRLWDREQIIYSKKQKN